MRVQSQAEVFALNGLIAAAILWLARGTAARRAAGRRARARRRARALESRDLRVLAPIGSVGRRRAGVRESERPGRSSLAMGVAALVAGLLPYMYLLVAPETRVLVGQAARARRRRSPLPAPGLRWPGRLSTARCRRPPPRTSRARGDARPRVPVAAGGRRAGVGRVAIKKGDERAGWLVWLASFVLAGPVLVARFNLQPEGLEHYTVQRFHLLPMVLLAVPVAVAIDRRARRAAARTTRPARSSASRCSPARRSRRSPASRVSHPCVQRSLENMLGTLPKDAIVIGTQDILHFGANYLQGALGERPDVTIVMMPQVGLGYYRDRMPQEDRRRSIRARRRAGGDAEHPGRRADARDGQAGVHRRVPGEHREELSDLSVRRALSRAAAGHGAAVDRGAVHDEQGAVREVPLRLPVPSPGDDLAAQAHMLYARTWRAIAAGLPPGASRDEAAHMAAALAPQ